MTPEILPPSHKAGARPGAPPILPPSHKAPPPDARAARFVARPLCPDLAERVGGTPCSVQLNRCGWDGATVTRFGNCLDAKRTCQACEFHPEALGVAAALDHFGSDKHAHHQYGFMYANLLQTRKPTRILEIGVLDGASIRAWRRLFPTAEIFAADRDPACADRVKGLAEFVRLDVGDRDQLRAFASGNPGRFDLVIDDSSHEPAHQLAIYEELFSTVAPSGVMVIEDIDNDGVAEALSRVGATEWDYRSVTGDRHSRAVTIYGRKPGAPARRRRPRVLFASHSLALGGATQFLVNLIPQLRGIEPVVFSPHDGPIRAQYERQGYRVSHHLNLDGVDAVVANCLPSATVVEKAGRRGIPVTWFVHESEPAMCGNLADVLRALPFAQSVVFPCRATADPYREWCGDRTVIVPSIVPPVPVLDNPPWHTTHLRGKCPHHLSGHLIRDGEAACRFCGEVPPKLVLVTAGMDEPRKGQQDIREAIADLPDVKLVTIHDRPHDEALKMIADADVYVCSSRVEAYPLAVQEAKLLGKPVITTPVYGCSEQIIHGVHGLHYQPGNVQMLRDSIVKLRDDHAFREACKRPLDHLPTFHESVEMYEREIGSLLGVGQGAQPVRVVYHCAGMGVWKSVVPGQLEMLARVGLREILCTHVGEEPDWLLDQAAHAGLKLTLCEYQKDVTAWECPAIRLIERIARNDDTPILYLHAKGVSHNFDADNIVFHDWRRLMENELIVPWRKNLRELSNSDLVGVNWWTNYPHFSGNFWMARADWIRRLPKFDAVYRDRYTCERWVGMAPRPRVKSLACSGVKFWEGEGVGRLYELLGEESPPAS